MISQPSPPYESAFAELCRKRRFDPQPDRIGRHDVLVTDGFMKRLFRLGEERVLAFNVEAASFRADSAEAMLDAATGVAVPAGTIAVAPIDVAGFDLDRVALVGPGCDGFFSGSAMMEFGVELIPFHSCEYAEADDPALFRSAIQGKALGVRARNWSRAPVPRAIIWRLDDGAGGLYRHTRDSRRSGKPFIRDAKYTLDNDCRRLPDGVDLSITDVAGRELRLRRDWDRLRGTLRLPAGGESEFDIPHDRAWEVFGPMFRGHDPDRAAIEQAGSEPSEGFLMYRVNNKYRSDTDFYAGSLTDCLNWLRGLSAVDGHFLVFTGRSNGCVQVMWQDRPRPDAAVFADGPRLWLESPDSGVSRGRYVDLDEAERMITILAREDRVAVAELGDLESR